MKADIERTEDGGWGSSCYGFNSLIGIENKRKMDSITIHFCKNGRNTFRDIFRSGSNSLRVEFRSDVIILRILRKIYYCFLLLDDFPFSLYRSLNYVSSNLLFIQVEMMLCIKILYLLSLHCQLHTLHISLYALYTLYFTCFTYHALYSVSQILYFLYHVSYSSFL